MEIIKSQKLKIVKIANHFQLKLIVVFGSFASGKNRKDSDLDIGIIGSREVSFEDQIGLTNQLSLIFNKNVDLSVLNNANPLLLFQASNNAILLYGSHQDFLKFKLYAFKSYHDYAPYFEMEKKLNKRIIKSYGA